MNTELRKKAQNEFENFFFKLMNNSVFGKTMENVTNQRDIKLVTSDKRRMRLVSEPNYHLHTIFLEHLMIIEMKKTRIKIAKPLYLGMSILDISKTLMYKLNQGKETGQNFITQILIVLLFTLKPKIFLKIFPMMLRDGLIHLTMIKIIKNRFQYERIKKYQVFLKMN